MKKYLFVTVLLMLSFNLFAQFEEDDEDAKNPYDLFKVKTNEKGLQGLIRIADNKLIIPYKYSDINLYDTNYFIVSDSLKNEGVFSLKDNKVLVACKYNDIDIVFKDFYPDDDNNPDIFCGIKGIIKKDNNIITDFYSPKGNVLITTPDDIEFSLVHDPDTIIGVTYTYRDYSDKHGYFLYNAKTGVLKSQKKCKITDYFPPYMVVKEETGVGVINANTGSFMIKPECDSIKMDFTDIYAYKKGKNEVLVNGKPLFPKGLYESISGSWYSNILKTKIWCVNKNGKWGAVDNKRNTVLPFEYDYPFEHTLGEIVVDSTWVSKNHKWGLINYKGEPIVPFQYDTVIFRYYDNYNKMDSIYFDYYLSKKDNKWGCLRIDGTTLLPFEFDTSFQYADSMFVVKNGKWKWIDRNNKELTKLSLDTTIYKDLTLNNNSIICRQNDAKIKLDLNGNCIGLLLDNGKVITSISEAINTGNVDGIKQFIKMGIDLNIKYQYHYKTTYVETDADGYPIALLLSSSKAEIKSNMTELFTLFLKHGVKLDTKDMEFSLIQYIVRSEVNTDEKIKMLQLYIENKGDVNAKGRYQNTALMEIVQIMKVFHSFSCEDACKISKFLLENGANPELEDSDGKTPEKIAKETVCKDLVQLLKSYKK